jgi:preprotein translocase subunit YajC
MSLNSMTVFLAMGAPPGQSGGSSAPFWVQLGPFILMMVIFYVILIRPQQKKARQHEELLKTLKPGDKVVTSGGIVGVVVSVKEKTISLRSAETKLEVLKSAVSDVTERAGETSAAAS